MIDRNGLKGKPISLKMDIEGAEMVALRYFPTSYLENIDNIVFEYHPAEQELTPDWRKKRHGFQHERFAGNLQIFRTLSEHFIPISFHFTNNRCYLRRPAAANQHYFNSSTVELSMVNKKHTTINNPTRSFKPVHDLEKPTYSFYWLRDENGNVKDCQYDENVDPEKAPRR